MNDIGTHLLLFAITGFVIVVLSSLFSESEDSAAFKTIPRRLVYFFIGCGAVAGVMLVLEHTVASVN